MHQTEGRGYCKKRKTTSASLYLYISKKKKKKKRTKSTKSTIQLKVPGQQETYFYRPPTTTHQLYDSRLLEKVVGEPRARHAAVVEGDLHKLAEATRVVVSQRLHIKQ